MNKSKVLSIEEKVRQNKWTKESWCLLGIWPCKFYNSNDLEKQNQNC